MHQGYIRPKVHERGIPLRLIV